MSPRSCSDLSTLPTDDAADLLDLGAADRLTVGDDRERLERRGGEPRRPRRELRALDRLGVLGAREDLPAAADLDELDAVAVDVVVLAQLVERGCERGLATRRDRAPRAPRSGSGERWRTARLQAASLAASRVISTSAKGLGCCDAALAQLRHLEQPEQRREDLPRLGAVRRRGPSSARARGCASRARMIVIAPGTSMRARDDVVDRRIARDAQDAVDGGEQLAERERERRLAAARAPAGDTRARTGCGAPRRARSSTSTTSRIC